MTLFLHGFTGSPRSGDALRRALGDPPDWDAPALLGHGAEVRTDATTFDEEVARLLRASTSTTLIGYSLGARIALAMTLSAPARFQRLVLVGLNPGLETADARDERVRNDEALASSLEDTGLESFVDRWERLPLFHEEGLSAEKREGRRAVRLSHDAFGLARSLRVLGLGRMPSFWGGLELLPQETHLVVGACDTKYVALAQRVQAKANWVRLHIVPGAGHDALLYSPESIAEVAA